MSKGKGPTKGSARFLQDQKKPARQNIHLSTGIVLRQRILPIVLVVAMLVTLAVRTGLCDPKPENAGTSTSTALAPLTAPLAAAGSSPVLLIAQDQASTAPPNDRVPSSQQENPAPSPPSPPTPPPRQRAASRSVLSEHLSSDLSEYLHQHHLPYVDALVFSNASGRPTLVKLSGQVRTEHGKEDAETKSSDFLNEPGLRTQNHIEVDAGLASTVPSSNSASVVPASSVGSAAASPMAAAPAIAANPCADLCLKDEGHCDNTCRSQAAGGASGGGLSIQGIMGQFGQSATQLQQCNEQCQQTREHCTYDCSQAASSGPPPEGADSGGARPDVSDHRSEGPDTPPE
jgi:hypothetical protein